MKKYFSLFLLLSIAVVTFYSCKPDTEIYNPKCKISKIWYRSEVGDPDETYIYDKHGKVLQQIVMENGESYDFTYNKDKSISKIVHVGPDYTEEIAFKSTKCLVDQMTYSIDGVVRMDMTVTHNDSNTRISTIEEVYDREFFELKKKVHPLYDKIIGNYEQMAEISRNCQSKELTLHTIKRFTYAPGKHKKYLNLSSYVEEFPTAQTIITHTFEYDLESFNPFYGLTFAYAGYAGYYLNNKTLEHIVTYVAGNLSEIEDITYSYEGTHYMNEKNYPRQFITTSSKNNVPVHTYILYKK